MLDAVDDIGQLNDVTANCLMLLRGCPNFMHGITYNTKLRIIIYGSMILFLSILEGYISTQIYGKILVLALSGVFAVFFMRKLFCDGRDLWIAFSLISWSLAPSFHIDHFRIEVGDVLLLLGVAMYFRTTHGKWFFNFFSRAYITYILTALLSVFVLTWYTSSFLIGASSAFRIVRLAGALFYFAVVGGRGTMQSSAIYKIIDLVLFGSVVGCIITIVEFKLGIGMTSQQFFTMNGVQAYRAGGTIYENAGAFGNYETILFGLALWMAYKLGGVKRILYLLLAGLFAFGAITSYSRAAMLGLVIILFVIWLGNRGKLVAAIAMVCITFVIVSFMNQLMPGYVLQVWTTRIVPLFSISSTHQFNVEGGGRLTYWKESLSFVYTHIWSLIVGVGYYGVTYASATFGYPMYTDNDYISAILEQGILGLLAFISFVFSSIFIACKRLSRGSFSWLVLSLWLSEAAQAFTGDVFTFWRSLPILFFITGIFYYQHVSIDGGESNDCIGNNCELSARSVSSDVLGKCSKTANI